MRISVACCTYNGALFLGDQLRSLVGQTRRPDEIVIVDDASVDGTAQIAEHFSRSAPAGVAVVFERNVSNCGVTENFQKAISLTSGELIFLCDQDDVWHTSKIETMCRVFDARADLTLLHSDARLIGARGDTLSGSLLDALEVSARERSLIHGGSAFSALLARNLVTGATVALRRSAFDAARPFPREWVHDEWLAIIAAALGSVDFVDAQLIAYRQHDANQIGMRRLTLSEKFAKLFRSRENRYQTMQRRVEVLLAKLIALGSVVPPDRVEKVREKLAHARVRAALPHNRAARFVPILREISTGRYARYSAGLRSIAQDFFEPA